MRISDHESRGLREFRFARLWRDHDKLRGGIKGIREFRFARLWRDLLKACPEPARPERAEGSKDSRHPSSRRRRDSAAMLIRGQMSVKYICANKSVRPPATCHLPPATCNLQPATCHLPYTCAKR